MRRVRTLVQSKQYEELEVLIGQGEIIQPEEDHERRLRELVEQLKEKDIIV